MGMTVGIIGQGFVGTAICEGLKGFYQVLTYDLVQEKCNSTLENVCNQSDVVFVCVPTPMHKNGKCDTRILEKAIDDAYNANNKEAQAEARKDLAAAFRLKAKTVNSKYIAPPKSTDFAIVYVPTEGLFSELSSYRDPKTKELLLQELRTKYKVTVSGPNTLSALLQSYHLGFQTLKVQQHATQIYSDLRNISSRFEKHFDGIKDLRKKLEQAMAATDGFGRDARSIMNTLGNIKDPEQVTDSLKENPEKIKVLK